MIQAGRRCMSYNAWNNGFIVENVLWLILLTLPPSRDLTTLDFSCGTYIKSVPYPDKPSTVNHLDNKIMYIIGKISYQCMQKRSRIGSSGCAVLNPVQECFWPGTDIVPIYRGSIYVAHKLILIHPILTYSGSSFHVERIFYLKSGHFLRSRKQVQTYLTVWRTIIILVKPTGRQKY